MPFLLPDGGELDLGDPLPSGEGDLAEPLPFGAGEGDFADPLPPLPFDEANTLGAGLGAAETSAHAGSVLARTNTLNVHVAELPDESSAV